MGSILALFAGPYALLVKGLLLAGALVGLYVYAQHRQYAVDEIKYESFVNATKAAGEKARADAAIREAADKANKEKADADNKANTDRLNATIKRLRQSHPSSSIVPASPTGATRPDLACYSRAEFVGAVGKLVDGVRELVDKGSKATLDLNSAKEWAVHLKMDTAIH